MCAVSMRGSAAYENTYTNTGNQRNDIIGVAKTQLGYKEGYNNDTKYGTWYGLPNQPWCAMFISWCARQAGIPTSVLKNSAVAAPDAKYFNIPYYDGTSYTPKSGDLFFTKSFSHVGLVYYVDGSYFYTIEGNSNTTGSSEGTSVVSNKRKTSNFYFGVPNYSGNISHTVNSSYGKNFTSYPKSKITAANIFDAYHNQISSTAWIGTSDKCTIHEVYTDGCCKVSYPLDSGGTKTVYSKISLFNTHKHSYSANYESAHPHKEYMKCSCGDWYYTGATKYVDSCTVCNPPRVVFDKSNVSLGLSKNKTAQVIDYVAYATWIPCQHTYSVIKTSVSNCTKEGYRLFECKTCGATKTETVAKNPSNHAGGTAVKNSKAATCTANGYTGDTYCLGCGVTTSKGREISAKGHSYDSGKITTAATCKATGVKTYTCTVCKATKTETVAKLNHRDSNGDGKCDMCGFKVGESGKPDTPDDSSNNCNHICHKSGFEHFLYIIVRMFWRLFKINQVCDCGFKHY